MVMTMIKIKQYISEGDGEGKAEIMLSGSSMQILSYPWGHT